jgi:hypothetical protein
MRSGFQRGLTQHNSPITTTKMADQTVITEQVSDLDNQLNQEETDEGQVSLGEQMAKMRKTLSLTAITLISINTNLASLNASVTDLNSSVHNLEISKTELKDDFSKLRSDINNDMEITRSSFNDKLTDLEKKVTEDYSIRHAEIVADLDAHKLEYNMDIEKIKGDIDDLTSLKSSDGTEGNQLTILNEIKKAIYTRDEKWEKLEAMLFQHIEETNNKFNKLQSNIDANTELINQLEAHGRRWALRIIGLPAPPQRQDRKHRRSQASYPEIPGIQIRHQEYQIPRHGHCTPLRSCQGWETNNIGPLFQARNCGHNNRKQTHAERQGPILLPRHDQKKSHLNL